MAKGRAKVRNAVRKRMRKHGIAAAPVNLEPCAPSLHQRIGASANCGVEPTTPVYGNT
jgi:hypothetical protein